MKHFLSLAGNMIDKNKLEKQKIDKFKLKIKKNN